jgi:hypothetical protein
MNLKFVDEVIIFHPNQESYRFDCYKLKEDLKRGIQWC